MSLDNDEHVETVCLSGNTQKKKGSYTQIYYSITDRHIYDDYYCVICRPKSDKYKVKMGLDLYIEARIREKTSRRIISFGHDKGYFEICWWCGWEYCDLRAKMIEICNKYAGTNYTDTDFSIAIPKSALREIYTCIVNNSYLPDDEPFEVLPCNIEWQVRGSYEKMNLVNAEKLHDILWKLNSIAYDNDIYIKEENVPDKNDLKLLEENPQAYEWEFRIFNSY